MRAEGSFYRAHERAIVVVRGAAAVGARPQLAPADPLDDARHHGVGGAEMLHGGAVVGI